MERAALYARVSTRRQEQEATIESQVERVLAYAQQNSYEVKPEHQYIDQAVSGQRLARPALDRLRDAALTGAFTVLLCLSPDRLARNLGAQQVILHEMKQAGVFVRFVSQPDLSEDPESQLLVSIQGAFAEYERVMISERMRRGRAYKLRHGQSVPTQAPYGYRYQPARAGVGSCWVVVAEQALIVKQVFAWYTEQGLPLTRLAERLNDRPTPGPRGGRWNPSTLGRMLRQAAYKGTAYYNRRQSDTSGIGQRRRQGRGVLRFPRYLPRPAEEWIEISVPAIVDEKTWQAAQKRLAMNAQFSRRNSRRTYLLRGLLVCGVCGYTLQGHTSAQRSYYRCTHGGKHRPPDVSQHTCSLPAESVEALIWQSLSELLQDPQQIEQAWTALQAQQAAPPSEVSRWQQRQALLRKQRQRLLDAYQADVISLEELIERQNPLDLELRDLQKRLADAPQPVPLQISLETFTQRIQRALAATDPATRQEVLRLLIERIVVTDEALTVQYIVPTVNTFGLHPTCRDT